MSLLTLENYQKGLLVDEELMAGVTEHPEQPGSFVAFVLDHTTGEYLGYEAHATVETALARINSLPREWSYEKAGGCGGGQCGDKPCGGAGCGGQNACGRDCG